MSIDVLSYRCIMIYLSMYLSNLSIYLSIHPSIHPSIYLSIYIYIYIIYIYRCRTVANGSFVCNARNEHMQERTHQRTYITRCTTVCVYIYIYMCVCVCARTRHCKNLKPNAGRSVLSIRFFLRLAPNWPDLTVQ